MDDIARCVCFPGHHQWSAANCSTCPAHQYKISFRKYECEGCPNAFYFVGMAHFFQPCGLAVQTCGVDSFWWERTLLQHAISKGDCAKLSSHSLAINILDNSRWGTSQNDCE